ncbi:dihydroorotase family protein [Chloroflexota bacterium]
MANYDLLIKGGRLVIPKVGLVGADIGILDGKIVEIAKDIPGQQSIRVIDASGKSVFPGAIDSHFHVGIYRPMRDDAVSESGSAAAGGVTTILSFFRTGKNYLNKIGPYREIFPEVLANSEGSFITDYSYHLAIMTREQLSEIEWLVSNAGISQFKYYMFYRKLDLAGSSKGDSYLMLKEPLDLGFLYDLMSEVAKANEKFRDYGTVRLAVHCEEPEIITACTRRVIESGGSGNLAKDYSDARPGWSERLAIHEVGAIAHETGCPLNLVHLTGQEAVDTASELNMLYPQLDILNEATLHHLSLSTDNKDYGVLGKVNPPIRDSEDVEYLWQAILDDYIQTVVSDHACLPKEMKIGDLWTALPGFGGTSLMFPVLITGGYHERGLPLERIAELASLNPAVSHNLYPKKGTIMIGSDADLAIVDIDKGKKVSTDILHSAQDYTPFEGMFLKGWVECTILRGEVIFKAGKVTGQPGYGQFLKRPVKLHHTNISG